MQRLEHRFELWAPNADVASVEVVLGETAHPSGETAHPSGETAHPSGETAHPSGETAHPSGETAHPMVRDSRGLWSARVAAGPGAAYRFRLNGDPDRLHADPRSHWQGEGSRGPSFLVDHAHPWTDAGWRPRPLAEAVLYEMHVGTFTPEGTYRAAEAKLGHLVALGITHIELMPVHQSSGGRNWGYDGVFLHAPYRAYGTPAELKHFVDACHARGLAILLDVVYNHFGPEGNMTGNFGPYTAPEERTPWGDAINLDGGGSDFVRDFLLDNARMWLEDYHFDGLRIDAMDQLRDRSPLHLMEELTERAARLGARLGRDFVVTAEFDQNDPRVVTPREEGGLGLDAQWVDNFHHALITALSGDRRGYYRDFGGLAMLAKALAQAIVFDGQYSGYRDKRYGRAYGGMPPDRFIVFSANHDQIGNRPLGDRPAHRLGAERTRIASALTLLSRFTPMLFQGEEWDASSPFQFFTDHQDPAIGEATAKGRGSSFGEYGLAPEAIPNPQAPETFLRSKLDWSEPDRPPHAGTHAWHRALIALRRSIAGFGREAAEVAFDEAEGWIAMRHSGVLVACNLGDAARDLPAPAGYGMALASGDGVGLEDGKVRLPANGVAVLATDRVRAGLPDFMR